jgi:hypothetical protein
MTVYSYNPQLEQDLCSDAIAQLLLFSLLSCCGLLRMKPAPWLPVFLECLSSFGRCMTYVYTLRHAQDYQCETLIKIYSKF